MSVPDDMTDERWADEAALIGNGWTPGRVKVSNGKHGPAFGWTNGEFGIFEGNSDTEIGRLELSSLTHLKSGIRIGMFSTPDAAVTAAAVAQRVGDWSEIDDNGLLTPEWKALGKQMYSLWQAAGLLYGPIVTTSGIVVWCAPEPIDKRN